MKGRFRCNKEKTAKRIQREKVIIIIKIHQDKSQEA